MKIRLSPTVLGAAYALLFSLLPSPLLAPLHAQPTIQPALVWPVKAGNPTVIEKPEKWSVMMHAVALSPDGQTLASGGAAWPTGNTGNITRGVILLCDAHTGAQKAELRGHDALVRKVTFSPDGKFLASQSEDGALFIWDVAARSLLHRLNKGNKTPIQENVLNPPRLLIGAWTPDSKTLATFETTFDFSVKPPSYTYTIKLFEANNGQLLRSFAPLSGYPQESAWTEDGKNLLFDHMILRDGSNIGSEIITVDGISGQILRRIQFAKYGKMNSPVVSISPGARYAVLNQLDSKPAPDGEPSESESIALWDLKNNQAIWTQPALQGTFRNATFSRDGKTLVAGTAEGEIVLYDAATGTVRQTLPTGGCNSITGLSISPDARRIVQLNTSSLSTYLWNLDAPLSVPRFTSQTILRESFLRSLRWSGDDIHLISLHRYNEKDPRVGREIHLLAWNATTGKMNTRYIAEKLPTGNAALSPDGTRLALKLYALPREKVPKVEGIGLYNLQTGQPLRVLAERDFSGMVWSPDGKTLAVNLHNDTVALWDTETSTKQRTLQTEARVMAWSPDGSDLAIGSTDGGVQIFDAQSGQEKQVWQLQGSVNKLAFAPDGKTLAVGITEMVAPKRYTTSLQLLDVQTGQQKRRFATQPTLRGLYWTANGNAIAAASTPSEPQAANGQLRLWDATTGEERLVLNDPCGIEDFVFSPDGTRVATYNGSRVRVWELK